MCLDIDMYIYADNYIDIVNIDIFIYNTKYMSMNIYKNTHAVDTNENKKINEQK